MSVDKTFQEWKDQFSYSWKDKRIKEINEMGYPCDDAHPRFEEVMAIYESKEKSYEEFIVKYLNENKSDIKNNFNNNNEV